jgi:hypothetical protein
MDLENRVWLSTLGKQHIDGRKTPKGVATAVHRAAVRYLEEIGLDSCVDYCKLWSPTESQHMGYGKAWHVMWEDGSPYEWASITTGYHSQMYNHNTVFAEPWYSFSLQFYNK